MPYILIFGEPDADTSKLCDQLKDSSTASTSFKTREPESQPASTLHWHTLLQRPDIQFAAVCHDCDGLALYFEAACDAELALFVMKEFDGLSPDLRRLGVIAQQTGVSQVLLAINIATPTNFSVAHFGELVRDFEAFARTLDLPFISAIPVSSSDGTNVINQSGALAWYQGKSLRDEIGGALDEAAVSKGGRSDAPARLAIRRQTFRRGSRWQQLYMYRRSTHIRDFCASGPNYHPAVRTLRIDLPYRL